MLPTKPPRHTVARFVGKIMLLSSLGFIVLCILVGFRLKRYKVSALECGLIYTIMLALFLSLIAVYFALDHATESNRNLFLDFRLIRSILNPR